MTVIHEMSGFDTVVSSKELRIRYVFMQDSAVAERARWMADCFPTYLEFPYTETGTSFLSTVNVDFDVLVVGGSDHRRIIRLLRANRVLLNRRLTVALMEGGNALRRAQVIAAGFDDAIDIGRVMPEEGMARVRAMWRRYAAHADAARRLASEAARLGTICDAASLSKKERTALLLLLEKGDYVPYVTLMARISPYHEPISFAHLKTVISILRGKLKPGVEIVSQPSIGYRLQLR